MGRWSIASILVSALSLVAAGSALAHTEHWDSTITIREKNGGIKFVGRVISDREACEKGRRVSLFTSEGDFVGDTETNNKGHWKFQFVGERYYAEVLKRVDGPNSHRHVCDPDRSPTTP